jgi:hypothetical protein
MDNEPHSFPRPPIGDGSTTTSPPASAARQLARHRGLAWVTAITLGAGAAGALGVAVSTGASLPGAITAASASTSGTTTGSTAQKLQSTTAPNSTGNAPVATSGAS